MCVCDFSSIFDNSVSCGTVLNMRLKFEYIPRWLAIVVVVTDVFFSSLCCWLYFTQNYHALNFQSFAFFGFSCASTHKKRALQIDGIIYFAIHIGYWIRIDNLCAVANEYNNNRNETSKNEIKSIWRSSDQNKRHIFAQRSDKYQCQYFFTSIKFASADIFLLLLTIIFLLCMFLFRGF